MARAIGRTTERWRQVRAASLVDEVERGLLTRR
jgi:hypothetical protein